MSNKFAIKLAANRVENRVAVAQSVVHDSSRWSNEKVVDPDDFGGNNLGTVEAFDGTYQEWIDEGFDDLRKEINAAFQKLKATLGN